MREPTVHLEFLPGLSQGLVPPGGGAVRLNVSLLPGETLGAVLSRLVGEGQRIAETVFDVPSGKLRPQVQVVVNDRLVTAERAVETVLEAGDRVAFVPVYAGG